jgi:hypothetical protein
MMRVDEAGQHDHFAGIDHAIGGRSIGREISHRSRVLDHVVAREDRRIRDRLALGVHRDQGMDVAKE